MAAARSGSSSRVTSAWVKASGSSGGTARPARPADHPGHLGALVHAGQHRPPGGQDRVRLGRHADRARPRRSGTRWMSPAASTSGRRSLGWKSTKRTLSSPARPPRGRPGPTAAVDHEHHVGPVRQLAGGVEHQVERLGQADVAGVHDHPAALQAVLAPVAAGLGVGGPDAVGVDEVGDDPDAVVGVGDRCPGSWPPGCRAGRRTGRSRRPSAGRSSAPATTPGG